MNDKQIKEEPYLVAAGKGADMGDIERTRSLSSVGQSAR